MRRVRTIFLSDIHLGTRACQAERLLSFLRVHEAEQVYLLGDIIDFWSLRRGIYWPPLHNTFVQKMLKRARHQVKVVFVPGNHDEALREYAGNSFGDIRVVRDAVHIAADGRRYLLMHGDEFDQITRYHRWVALLGDIAYNLLLRLNVLPSWLRRNLHLRGYWSLADYAKRKLKGALEFVYGFEQSVAHHAHLSGYDGVVCGHIHSAAIKIIGGITYINCGDWVDSCTAIVERDDGSMELVHWRDKEVLAEDLLPETLLEEAPVLARVVPLRQRRDRTLRDTAGPETTQPLR
jgi:UDP-2,3-diacylglucosamine pyrophosphatase LpxH